MCSRLGRQLLLAATVLGLGAGACTRLGYSGAADAGADGDGDGDGDGAGDGAAAGAPAARDAAADAPDAGAGGLVQLRGELLFYESFDDDAFGSRGWYDDPGGTITNDDPAPGSSAALECRFDATQGCGGGVPRRRLFAASESLYVSYWIKYDSTFSSAIELFILTDADGAYVGPSSSHFSASVDSDVQGRVYWRFEDNANIDARCVKLTNGELVGCAGGSFDDFPFSEARSVCACNGLLGDLDEFECAAVGAGQYYSRRYWYTPRPLITAETSGQWHLVELYLRMNTIQGGVGVPDGALRYARDGEVLIAHDHILLRTAQNPTMAFNQVLLGPTYAEPGDRLWLDELTVARGR